MDKYTLLRYGLNLFELLACVTGFLYWNKLRHSWWKWFPIYLGGLFLLECLGEGLLLTKNLRLNGLLYNYVAIPLQFLFFFWLFARCFRNTRYYTWAPLGAILYVACFVIDKMYFSDVHAWFSSFSYTAGNVLLLGLIIVFFFQLVSGNGILQYKSNMMFWVCIGLLVFYLGSLPFYGLWNTLVTRYPRLFNTYWMIQIGFDYLMYIFFTIGFVCAKLK